MDLKQIAGLYENYNNSGEDSLLRRIWTTKDTLMSRMERALHLTIHSSMNQVMPLKSEPAIPSKTATDTTASMAVLSPVNGYKRRLTLTESLLETYRKERQTDEVYETKIQLRQRIYSLLSKKMIESIDLFMIGSSQTGMGSKKSDTDLCLVIYDSDKQIDRKYEEKDIVLSKLEELSGIFESERMAEKAQVIPALVPILKFTETETNIEVNININKLVTIQNTHLLYAYSRIDQRVPQLVLILKLWAEKNGIKSAFNKSLTSYSISLMAIHFLQKACSPPVVPCLQLEYPYLFDKEPTQLSLQGLPSPLLQQNCQSLGQLFIDFFEYFAGFDFNKVISVRSAALLDRQILMCRHDSNVKLWQWKCHICIEEPFTRTNTSHAVHDCRMYRQIVQTIIDTHIQLTNGSFAL